MSASVSDFTFLQGVKVVGQVLVTSTVKDLVVGSGIRFEDLGSRTLKGVPDEWRLYRPSPSSLRAALRAGNPESNMASAAWAISRCIARSCSLRAGAKPGSNGGMPGRGARLILEHNSANLCPALSQPAMTPNSASQVTTRSVGSRRSSSITSRA